MFPMFPIPSLLWQLETCPAASSLPFCNQFLLFSSWPFVRKALSSVKSHLASPLPCSSSSGAPPSLQVWAEGQPPPASLLCVGGNPCPAHPALCRLQKTGKISIAYSLVRAVQLPYLSQQNFAKRTHWHHAPAHSPQDASGSIKLKLVTNITITYINTYIATLEFITCVLSVIKTQACESLPCGAANLQKNKRMRKIKRCDRRLDVKAGTSEQK